VLGVMAEEGGGFTYFLVQGEKAHVAKDGDVLSGQYRINGLKGSQLSFQYLPMDKEQLLAIPTGVLTGQTGPVGALTGQTAAPGENAESTQSGPIANVQLGWKGPAEIKPGERMTVSMTAKTEVPIASLHLVLSYDPTAVENVSVQEGDLIKRGGGSTEFSPMVDDATRRIEVKINRQGEGGATGEGELFKIALTPKKPGAETRIGIVSAMAAGPAQRTLVLLNRLPYRVRVQ
jgi:hypothetical protein